MHSQGVLFAVLINTTNTAYLFTIHEKLAKELTNDKNQKNSLFIYIKVYQSVCKMFFYSVSEQVFGPLIVLEQPLMINHSVSITILRCFCQKHL